MKILHLNDKIEIKGGVEVYIEQLMQSLPGYNCMSHWWGIYLEGSAYSIKIYNRGNSDQAGLSLNQMVEHLSDYILKNAIDVIHVHSISNPRLLRSLFWLAPIVRSMHEPRMICPGQGKFWRHSERICTKPFGLHCLYHAYKEGCCNRHPKRLFNAYNNTEFEVTEGRENYRTIIVMSDYMKKEAIKAGFHPGRIVLNPYCTPVVIEPAIENTINSKNKRLLYVGRLSRTKGVHYFIEVGLNLILKNNNLHFDIVGGGHDETYFKSLVPKEMKEYFTFHGWQDRDGIDQIISSSYLLVFPSIYPEAFGISGIEAMMRGKPVVGFDVGGVTTWLKNNETGFSVPVKNVEMMVDKIQELLTNQVLYKRMSETSRKVAIEKFSPKVHINKLLSIYKSELEN